VAQDKFNKYIRFAKTIVEALPPGEVPVDLADTLEFMKACDMFVAHEHDELGEQYLKDAEETVANGYEPCRSVVKVSFMTAEDAAWCVNEVKQKSALLCRAL